MTMSFDGFFAGPQGELDWMSAAADKELNDDMVAILNGADAGLMGFPVAQGMIAYWASVEKDPNADEGSRAIAKAVNRMQTYLLSNKEEAIVFEHSKLVVAKSDEEVVNAVTALKQLPGKALGVPGGIRTAQTLVRLGLIDEYNILIHPVALGKGQRVFTEKTKLELIDIKPYKCGVIRARYRNPGGSGISK